MNSKKFVWVGMSIGMFLGGLLPAIWGSGEFSFSSIIFSAIGGIIGIIITFKMSH